MKILRAFGFGIFLLTLIVLMPDVFSEFSETLIVFFQSSQQAFAAAGVIASYAAHVLQPLP